MDVMIRRGDSCWYYSRLFSIDLQLIHDSNEGIDPNQLAIGQRVKIPGFVASDYQLKAGDSLWSIARNRTISLDALFLLNPSLNVNTLQIGQVIFLPLRITWRLVTANQEYSYARMINDLNRLRQVYPFLKMPSAGETVLGKSIPEVLLGKGDKRVHYNASFHANEWITTLTVMTFLNDYLLSLTNQNPIRGVWMNQYYQQTSLSIVPMVNPDGVDLVLNGPPEDEPYRSRVLDMNGGNDDFSGWKANINGVDLNDQFPARWELEKERNPPNLGPRDYPGEEPLTEPEAIAMATLTRKRDFDKVLAFHTQGKVIYWGFENLEPSESRSIAAEFSRVSNYEPIQSIDSYAGYKDWFIQDWRRPGFTVELGQGVNPLPLTQFPEIYEEALGIFLAGLYM
ncbi:M14 family metallopeptidase [Bacillus massiliglaciei]|uniref:M14 family metallopeptidase n=1 Tax=Bacillus massiliglaciei TaxID=1816693 RepID=UPI000AB7CE34|nr:M14 family metallopeptidase [Bacillus massiliglaciei]